MKSPTVQMVSPLPPLPTGIAQYTRDLLAGIAGRWPLAVLPEPGSASDVDAGIEVTTRRRFDRDGPAIVQLGNSAFHEYGFEIAEQHGQMIVLHDVVLHHAILADAVRHRKTKQYRRLMRETYGPVGEEFATQVLHGQGGHEILDFPLSEPFIDQARLTVVHNHVAARLVYERCPDAHVVQIPMGVPLPALVPATEARRALGIPESAFVVASITHVNPMKRLDVVLRALKDLVRDVPEAQLIIAGTVAPEVDLQRLVHRHSLERHVQIWGYVEDDRARLLARAADVCVNLRHPTTGETSASLLRLLGAAKPVIVSDNIPTSDLRLGVGLRVPVDRFEAEMVTALLNELAHDPMLRSQAGEAARAFVEEHHTLYHMIEGYRVAIEQAFGISLPKIVDMPTLYELAPNTGDASIRSEGCDPPRHLNVVDEAIVDAISDLQISPDLVLNSVAEASVELGLNSSAAIDQSTRVERIDSRVICPRCRSGVSIEGNRVRCLICDEDLGTIQLVDGRLPPGIE